MSSDSPLKHIDVGLIAGWNKRDYEHTTTFSKKVNELIKCRDKQAIKLVESFDNKLERVYNDQTTDIEPLHVGRVYDRVVNDGMIRIAELVTNTIGLNTTVQSGQGGFVSLASGIGTNPVSASDYQLQSENARIAFGFDAYMLAAGSVMRFGAFFAPSIPSAVISESGVFDDFTAGVMLYRTVYSVTDQWSHIVNRDYYSISHAIYQSSI